VEKAAQSASRPLALEAALRYLEKNREAWTPETTSVISRLLATTTESEPRKKLVALLHRADDPAALTLAENSKADAEIGADAAIAADVIRANLKGRPRLRASNPTDIANMIDGKTSTRWTTPVYGEEWVEVDFNLSRPLRRITLDQTNRSAEFPEQYEVFVTDDPQRPGTAVVSGKGQANQTVIELPAGTRGRYLIVKNVADRKDTPWAICELYVE